MMILSDNGYLYLQLIHSANQDYKDTHISDCLQIIEDVTQTANIRTRGKWQLLRWKILAVFTLVKMSVNEY